MLVTDQAKLIRTTVGDIRIAGRNTQGVTIFRVAEGEKVVSAARIDEDDEPENEAEELIAEDLGAAPPAAAADTVQLDDGTGPETLPDSQEGEDGQD
jgi:DNA gyrase subunit A